jgi:putative ABC transport system ATP-binding protein
MAALLQTQGLVRTYQMGGETIHALDGVTLSIQRGEFVSVIGRSGSGKSTLLHVVGCLDRPDAGTVWLDGQDVTHAARRDLPHIRATKVGFIFQQYNLIPTLTALENVMLALKYARVPRAERRERALHALSLVGLAERADHLPAQLSGGQQQRVAIARGLVNRPSILLGDEVTGALDTQTAGEVIDLLQRLNRTDGQTCVLVTHDPMVSAHTDRVIRMSDGRVERDERRQAVS